MIKNIVLLNPPLSAKSVFGDFADWGGYSIPTGLCYIASFLRQHKYNVSIVDADALKLNIEETVEKIIQLNPDILGITAKTMWIINAYKVATAIKKKMSIPVVIGGHHVTALPEKTLIDFLSFDIGVLGEGENTFLEIIENINSGKDISNIQGTVTRINESIKINSARQRINNLDELPVPAWDLLPDISTHYRPWLFSVKKLPAFQLMTSRGCPWHCTFCDRSVFGNNVTYHSPEYIVSIIKHVCKKYKVKHIMFDDDNLLLHKKKLLDLLRLLKENKIYIPFSCESRVDNIDDEILKSLKKAGCWQIQIGIESGSQIILDKMDKRITVNKIKNAIDLIHKNGIRVFGYILIGYPGETIETLEQTVNLIKECKIDDIGVNFFSPLPGALIYKDVRKYGEFNEDWENMNSMNGKFYIPQSLTTEIMEEYAGKCYNACYLKMSQILTIYRRFTTFTHCYITIKSLFKMIIGKF